MAAIIIFITIAVLVLIVVVAAKAGGGDEKAGHAARLEITKWQIDNNGGWVVKPQIRIGELEYSFDTPIMYARALKELREKWADHPEADLLQIDAFIVQFESAQRNFGSTLLAHNTKDLAPQPSAEPFEFELVVNPDGCRSLGKLMEAIRAGNHNGVSHWLTELNGERPNDVVAYVGRVLATIEATALLACWLTVDMTAALPNNTGLQKVDYDILARALNAVERFLACTPLLPIPPIQVPGQLPSMLPEHDIRGWLADLDATASYLEPRSELGRGRRFGDIGPLSCALLRSALLSDDGVHRERVPVAFSELAMMLSMAAHISSPKYPDLGMRCARCAQQFMSHVQPDDEAYGLVITASLCLQDVLGDARLDALKGHTFPAPSKSVRLTLDGNVELVDVGTLQPLAGIAPSVAEPKSEAEVLRTIEKSLLGLVGLDGMKPLMAMDVFEFLSAGQSRGRVFWGSSGVGKTEVAQRLAGLREGFPGLSLGGGQVRYVSGVDGKLEVKELIDSLPAKSILFIDEADKCLDPKAGMVSAAEATQVRHAIITHFQRKPVLWVFLGVFSQMRSEGVLTDESLRVNFGDELAHRLDYADWGFPAWTLENLLKAVNGASSRRKLRYDDDAALVLAQYCLKTGGGVRAFDNLETAIIRHIRTTGSAASSVSLPVARDVLTKRGVQVA